MTGNSVNPWFLAIAKETTRHLLRAHGCQQPSCQYCRAGNDLIRLADENARAGVVRGGTLTVEKRQAAGKSA